MLRVHTTGVARSRLLVKRSEVCWYYHAYQSRVKAGLYAFQQVIEQGDKRVHELAIAIDKIFWFRQPIVRMQTHEIVAYEMLARTMNDVGGTVSAWNLIDEINQHDDLVKLLDRRAVRFAVNQLKRDKGAGLETVYAVNLGSATVDDPQFIDFASKVMEGLEFAGLQRSCLRFELTEHRRYSSSGVLALRNIGGQIGADDFGEGYNSLSTFADNDFDFVKIGGRFTKGLLQDSIKNRAVVKSILVMAKELGIPVVFESVETEPIARLIFRVWLSSPVFQCDLWGQGWHYGRDVSCQQN